MSLVSLFVFFFFVIFMPLILNCTVQSTVKRLIAFLFLFFLFLIIFFVLIWFVNIKFFSI
jgi:hypothetical protein